MSSSRAKSVGNSESGFSLIDVVVTVAIIVALSVGGFVSYSGLITNAKRAAVGAAADQVFTAVRVAENDGNSATNSDSVKSNYEGSTSDIRVDITGSGDTLSVIATNVGTPGIRAMRGAEGSVAPPAPAIIQRTNLASHNTRAAASIDAIPSNSAGIVNNRWFGGGGAGVRSQIATGGPSAELPSFVRKAWTTAPTGGNSGDIAFSLTTSFSSTSNASFGLPVKAGVPYSVSLHTRSSFGLTGSTIRAIFKDASGTMIGGEISGANTLGTPGSWGRVSATYTPPAGAAYMELIWLVNVNNGGIVVGGTLDATGLLIEQSDSVGTYFDGLTPGRIIDGIAYTYGWSGAPNASQSVASYLPPSE